MKQFGENNSMCNAGLLEVTYSPLESQRSKLSSIVIKYLDKLRFEEETMFNIVRN